MWFAALGQYQHNPWFVSLVDKLLKGNNEGSKVLRFSKYWVPKWMFLCSFEVDWWGGLSFQKVPTEIHEGWAIFVSLYPFNEEWWNPEENLDQKVQPWISADDYQRKWRSSQFSEIPWSTNKGRLTTWHVEHFHPVRLHVCKMCADHYSWAAHNKLVSRILHRPTKLFWSHATYEWPLE